MLTKNIIRFLLYRTETYWIVSKLIRKFSHSFLSFVFLIHWRIRSTWRHAKYLIDFLRLSSKEILLALFLCVGLYFIESKLFSLNVFSDDGVLEKNADSFLAAVAGIGGVIIGMYYAGVLSLGTSVYSKLPKEAKDLLAKEPAGSVFMRFLAFLTFVSVTLLLARFLGYRENHIAVEAVLVMVGIALFSMTKMGSRLFYLTDPTLLSESSLRLLDDLFKTSTVGSFQWNNPNFQNYYKQQAKISIRTINTLADYAKTEHHLSSESLFQLGQQAIASLYKYQNLKNRIPGGSFWYSTKYKHKNWYLQSDINLETSSLTGNLPPTEIQDKLWVETELSQTMLECFEINLKADRYDVVDECIQLANWIGRRVATNGEIDFAIDIYRKLNNVFLIAIKNRRVDQITRSRLLRDLNICDGLGLLKTNIVIGGMEYLECMTEPKVDSALATINWRIRKTLYQTGLPYQLHERLLFLFDLLEFESETEGEVITPQWYIKQLVTQAIAFETEKTLISIKTFVADAAPPFTDAEILQGKKLLDLPLWINCISSDRGYEHHLKLLYFTRKAEAMWSNFLDRNKLDEAAWPLIDWKQIERERISGELKVIEDSARCGALARLAAPIDDIPDFSGKFLHRSGDKIIEFLTNNPPVFSESLFKSFFINSLMMFDELRKKKESDPEWLMKEKLQVATAPIIDLISVSGYCILMSEYSSNKEITSVVTTVWNNYFDENDKKNKTEKLKLFAAALSLPTMSLSLPHRGILRTKWFQQVRDFLFSTVPNKNEWYQPKGALGYQERIVTEHSSALVKVFMKQAGRGIAIEGDDIFIDKYFLSTPESAGVEYKHHQGRVNDLVKREEEKYGGSNNED